MIWDVEVVDGEDMYLAGVLRECVEFFETDL